jgi:hypothetical protein
MCNAILFDREAGLEVWIVNLLFEWAYLDRVRVFDVLLARRPAI